MSREVRSALTWMSLAFLGVLMAYALIWIGQALFDGPGPDREYLACIGAGGDYSTNGTGKYDCEMPK